MAQADVYQLWSQVTPALKDGAETGTTDRAVGHCLGSALHWLLKKINSHLVC